MKSTTKMNKRKIIIVVIIAILVVTAIYFAVFFIGKFQAARKNNQNTPNNQNTAQNKSEAEKAADSMDKAFEDLKTQAQRENNQNPDMLISLAKLSASKEDYVSAQTYVDEAMKLDAKNPIAYVVLAEIDTHNAKYDDVIANGLKALDLIQKDSSLANPVKIALKSETYFLLSSAYMYKSDVDNSQKYTNLSREIAGQSNKK